MTNEYGTILKAPQSLREARTAVGCEGGLSLVSSACGRLGHVAQHVFVGETRLPFATAIAAETCHEVNKTC
jgi:hypothetical protein